MTIRRGRVGPPPAGAAELPLGLWRSDDAIGLVVADTASYLVSDGREIVVDEASGADPLTVRLYLLGTMMGALMMQRGHLVLHGNAFRVGDSCAVVVGRSGAGKSTLAAELLRRGHDVLADDVVPVDRDGRALPGYPRIKLWGDAVSRLGVDPGSLERVANAVEKFQLPITRSGAEALPLRWIYVLERHTGAEIELSDAVGMETFSLLHEHSYRNELIHGDDAVREHLELCSRVAGLARVRRVTRPAETMTAEATADAILADIARSSASGTVEESA